MKKFFAALSLSLAFALVATAQGGVVYSLPQTTLEFTVEASRETFHAGPFARYAGKYLGVEARSEDGATYAISSIKVRTLVEPDLGARHSVMLGSAASQTFLQLTNLGLVAGPEGSCSVEAGWKYPSRSEADFVIRGLPANLTSSQSTLYTQDMGTVRQSAVVEKSDEMKAAEVAARIFEIRDNRYKILVGDTDATYSGEAMKATIDALDKLEADYLTLFTGYSEKSSQTATFEVVPDPSRKNQTYVAFRVSDAGGLVSADDIDGKPVYMELVPEPLSAPLEGSLTSKSQGIHYRIPAVCTLTLRDMQGTLLTMRVPVYQLGEESVYPILKK